MAHIKNVFLVHTEYHLFQSVNMAVCLYKDSVFRNIIYIDKRNRLRDLAIQEKYVHENIQFIVLNNLSHKEVVDTILNESMDHFLFFQESSSYNLFLTYRLSKRNIEISLGPDGYKPYAVYDKKNEYLSLIKNTFIGYRNLYKSGIKFMNLIALREYKYSYYPFINNTWLTHPNQYIHKARTKVNLKLLPKINKESIKLIEELFEFSHLTSSSDSIYYFNQPARTEKQTEKELSFLKETVNFFKDKKVYIKLHPLTKKDKIEKYSKIANITIIESAAPAEIILLQLNNCIVFTGYSTVLITENESCNYYFNYPIYKNCGMKNLDQSNLTVLDHINVIQTPQEMTFPKD